MFCRPFQTLGLDYCSVVSGESAAAASGNLGSKKSKKQNFSKFKSVLPKTSARSGLIGKNPPGPVWGHLRQLFPWTGKIQKMYKIRLFSLVGQWVEFGLMCWCHHSSACNGLRLDAVDQALEELQMGLAEIDDALARSAPPTGDSSVPTPPPRVDSSKGPPWVVQKKVDFGPISPSSP